MSNSNQINFVSLIQLCTYSGLKSFLEQYHQEVKKDHKQFLGINKALISASKVIKGFKNHHEMAHNLKSVENNGKIFEVAKIIITVTIAEKVDDEIDLSTEAFNSWDSARNYLISEFTSLAMREDTDNKSLLECFSDYYDEDDLENFEDSSDFINHIKNNDSIGIYYFLSVIEHLTFKETQISISERFVALDITTDDIDNAITFNKFETKPSTADFDLSDKLYIEDDNIDEIIFNIRNNNEFKFKHHDCSMFFTSDGYHLYASDIDNLEHDCFSNGDFIEVLNGYYGDSVNDVLDLLTQLKKAGLELELSDHYNTHNINIDDLYKKIKSLNNK